MKACEKRPVPVKTLEEIAERVEQMVQESPDREVPSTQIGEYLMESLRKLDKVAFVRFASVYRDFKDVDQFMATLKGLETEGASQQAAAHPSRAMAWRYNPEFQLEPLPRPYATTPG